MAVTPQDVTALARAFAKAQGHPSPDAFAELVAKHHGAGAAKAAKAAAPAPKPTVKGSKKGASKH